MKKPMTTPFSLALRQARPLIASNREQFICLALKATGALRSMRVRVGKQMGGCYVYEHWVLKRHPGAYREMRSIGYEAFKAGRLAWIDDMIRREEK